MPAKQEKITIHCAFDKLVPVEKLTPNPRNPNHHPAAQIWLLAKIIEAQGWRAPITVSKRSGFIVRGHGRLEAALLLGEKEVPVDYQDYTDEAMEWADMIADNRLAELAETNFSELADLLVEIDTGDLDMDVTGFLEQDLERIMTATVPFDPEKEWEGMPEYANEDMTAPYHLIIHFRAKEDKLALGEIIGQDLTEKTQSVYQPAEGPESFKDVRVKSES